MTIPPSLPDPVMAQPAKFVYYEVYLTATARSTHAPMLYIRMPEEFPLEEGLPVAVSLNAYELSEDGLMHDRAIIIAARHIVLARRLTERPRKFVAEDRI